MIDKKEVLKALDCLANNPFLDCDKCPYNAPTLIPLKQRCDYTRICANALALLKERGPRVLTLEELWNVGRFWESSAPPYLWLEKNRSIYNTISFWCAWRDIYEMVHGSHYKYTDENYGSGWRVWTLQPTPEQMRDTPWEGENDATN